MRTIGVLTGARADYSIYRPILAEMAADPRLRPLLFVTGMHLSPEHGMTVSEIEADGYAIAERIECLQGPDSPGAVAQAMGRTLSGMARALERHRPDLLLVLGDRFEMFAGASAAVPLSIPLAHVHGGEVTYGAMDESFRHAITKLSHLHFASTARYAERILQMGEEPWRITACGAPALDGLLSMELPGADELSAEIGFDCRRPFLLVTFHPATRDPQDAASQADIFFSALAQAKIPVLATAPNADPGGRAARRALEKFATDNPDVMIIDHLGARRYAACMRCAAAMAGNSSSGIIEAASFELPVVNVGSRQEGRIRAANVLDTPLEPAAIQSALSRALAPEFRASLKGLVNPYGPSGQGKASAVIVETLAAVDLGPGLLRKLFHDLHQGDHNQ